MMAAGSGFLFFYFTKETPRPLTKRNFKSFFFREEKILLPLLTGGEGVFVLYSVST